MMIATEVNGCSNHCMCCVLLWKLDLESTCFLHLMYLWHLLYVFNFLPYVLGWNMGENKRKYSWKTVGEISAFSSKWNESNDCKELPSHVDCPSNFDTFLVYQLIQSTCNQKTSPDGCSHDHNASYEAEKTWGRKCSSLYCRKLTNLW